MSGFVKLLVNRSGVVNAQQFAEQQNVWPEWMDGINRLDCGSGPRPSIGTFLITRADYDDNFPEDGPFPLGFERQCDDENTIVQFEGYVTVSAQAAIRQPGSPMVVTIADARHFLRLSSTNRNWNVGTTETDTWADVLADLISDLPDEFDGFAAQLAYDTEPTYTLSNLKYEGVSTLDALANLASRTGHVLIYDPFVASLKFEPMSGTQDGVDSELEGAKVHREFETPELDAILAIGEVQINFDPIASSLPSDSYVETNGAIPSDRSANAWAATLGDEEADVSDEGQVLADTWFDWSDREVAKTVVEYFGPLELRPGSQISEISWIVNNLECYTLVVQGAPPPPITGRQSIPGGGGLMFPLDLEWVGGEDGSSTQPATWTYNVRAFESSAIIYAGANPVLTPHKYRRPTLGMRSKANFGYGTYDALGQLVIGWINEVPIVGTC